MTTDYLPVLDIVTRMTLVGKFTLERLDVGR